MPIRISGTVASRLGGPNFTFEGSCDPTRYGISWEVNVYQAGVLLQRLLGSTAELADNYVVGVEERVRKHISAELDRLPPPPPEGPPAFPGLQEPN